MKIYFKDYNFIISVDMITGKTKLETGNISNINIANYQSLKEYKEKFGIAFPFLTDGESIVILGSPINSFKPNNRNELAPPFKYNVESLSAYMSLLIKNMIIKPYIDESEHYVADTFQINYDDQKCKAEISDDSYGYYLDSGTKPNNWILKALGIKDNEIKSILGRDHGGLWPYGSKEDIYSLIDYINSNYSNNKDTSALIVISDRFYFRNQYYDYKQSKKNGWYIKIDLKILAKYLTIDVQSVRAKLCQYSNNKIGVFPEFKTKEYLMNGLKRLLNVHLMFKS